jgi:hypothetical protein
MFLCCWSIDPGPLHNLMPPWQLAASCGMSASRSHVEILWSHFFLCIVSLYQFRLPIHRYLKTTHHSVWIQTYYACYSIMNSRVTPTDAWSCVTTRRSEYCHILFVRIKYEDCKNMNYPLSRSQSYLSHFSLWNKIFKSAAYYLLVLGTLEHCNHGFESEICCWVDLPSPSV